uniref:Uncharacterized protein n=1 Tax=Romanomermis culicivorax TaxID=13658 RepID=A0A915IWT5_ROMCU
TCPLGPGPQDVKALATTINNLLKLTLADINNIASITPEATAEEDIMTTSDKTLTDIPEEMTVKTETAMDVATLTVDLAIYLVMPAMLRSPLIVTVAIARKLACYEHFIKQKTQQQEEVEYQ